MWGEGVSRVEQRRVHHGGDASSSLPHPFSAGDLLRSLIFFML